MTNIESAADVAAIDQAICTTHGDTDLAALVNVAVAGGTATSPDMLRQLIWMAVVLAYLQGAWDGRHGEDTAAPSVVSLGRIVASIRKVRALVLRQMRTFGHGRSSRRPSFESFAEQFPDSRLDAAQRA